MYLCSACGLHDSSSQQLGDSHCCTGGLQAAVCTENLQEQSPGDREMSEPPLCSHLGLLLFALPVPEPPGAEWECGCVFNLGKAAEQELPSGREH